MASTDATPQSLFPAAARPPDAAPPAADGSFRTPGSVEFPMFTCPEDDALTAFGSRVQADRDLDMLDARVSHVRDVQYEPGSYPPEALSPVASAPPPVTRRHERAWGVVVLAVLAAGVLAGLAGVFFLTR